MRIRVIGFVVTCALGACTSDNSSGGTTAATSAMPLDYVSGGQLSCFH